MMICPNCKEKMAFLDTDGLASFADESAVEMVYYKCYNCGESGYKQIEYKAVKAWYISDRDSRGKVDCPIG